MFRWLLVLALVLVAGREADAAWCGGGGIAQVCPPAVTGTTVTINPGDDVQGTINAAAAGTTVLFNDGTYTLGSTVTLKSGVNLRAVHLGAAKIIVSGAFNHFEIGGLSNIKAIGFTIDGGPNGGGGQTRGAFFIENSSNNIEIAYNTFCNNTNQSEAFVFNSDNINFHHNQSGAGCPAEFEPFSGHQTDGVQRNNWNINDNSWGAITRFGIESSANVNNYHIDRNTIKGTVNIGISIVDNNGVRTATNCTISGNQILTPVGSGAVGIELGQANCSVEQNAITADIGSLLSAQPGSEWENNTFNTTDSTKALTQDGGYNSTEWIGSNTVNGARQIGWPGHPLTSPGTYGTQPAVNSSSLPSC